MKIFLTPKHISHTYNEQFDRISHTYLEGKTVLFFLDKIMQKTAPFSGSVPLIFMTAGILYLSPLEGVKPPREGDRHSPYYANMRLEFIN